MDERRAEVIKKKMPGVTFTSVWQCHFEATLRETPEFSPDHALYFDRIRIVPRSGVIGGMNCSYALKATSDDKNILKTYDLNACYAAAAKKYRLVYLLILQTKMCLKN